MTFCVSSEVLLALKMTVTIWLPSAASYTVPTSLLTEEDAETEIIVKSKCSELNVSEIDRRVSVFSSGLSTCEPYVDDPQAQSESTINTVNRKAKFLLMVAPLISDDLIVSWKREVANSVIDVWERDRNVLFYFCGFFEKGLFPCVGHFGGNLPHAAAAKSPAPRYQIRPKNPKTSKARKPLKIQEKTPNYIDKRH